MEEEISIIKLPDGTSFETPSINEDDAIRVQRVRFQGMPEFANTSINIYAQKKVNHGAPTFFIPLP